MSRVILVIGFLILVFFELGIMPILPEPWRFITITPLALIAMAIYKQGPLVWALALVAGLLFDSFSLLPTGTFTILMPSLVWFLRLLFFRWFTSRSPLSFITMVISGLAWFFILLSLWRSVVFFITRNQLYSISMGESVKVIGLGISLSTGVFLLGMFAVYGLRLLLSQKFLFTKKRF